MWEAAEVWMRRGRSPAGWTEPHVDGACRADEPCCVMQPGCVDGARGGRAVSCGCSGAGWTSCAAWMSPKWAEPHLQLSTPQTPLGAGRPCSLHRFPAERGPGCRGVGLPLVGGSVRALCLSPSGHPPILSSLSTHTSTPGWGCPHDPFCPWPPESLIQRLPPCPVLTAPCWAHCLHGPLLLSPRAPEATSCVGRSGA